ncbi:MAG: toll/interleukin-1 receptor domain-containing protein [Acidobacteria bacterium]|nr:toll/interleukin-1 receptor domain-containing protein [Acidobacteriota bacterium]
MADPEHLKILKQGAKVWNKWRSKHEDVQPNLRAANLRHANLRNADLSDADLSHARLINANLSDAKLIDASLHKADLCRANFRSADLRNADLRNADLSGSDLSGADLSDARLINANLRNANLSGADLNNASLSTTDLRGADLSDARLINANLSYSIVNGADFTYSIMGFTTLARIDLSEAKGLETVRHVFPSTIGIDTIYKSQGNIPELFLHGCGVPDEFITYMRSLVAHPIQFYSCFISYSSKDQDFANRLYADLQSKGVRCWFAPEDLKIGDKFRNRIDESIRVYDKLLLVLSENSVSSQWVEKEVETALEREREQNKTMLFPVRLDDAVNELKVGWPADVRRNRHIGDFVCWKDHDSYQKAFDRLIRDLQADNK